MPRKARLRARGVQLSHWRAGLLGLILVLLLLLLRLTILLLLLLLLCRLVVAVPLGVRRRPDRLGGRLLELMKMSERGARRHGRVVASTRHRFCRCWVLNAHYTATGDPFCELDDLGASYPAGVEAADVGVVRSSSCCPCC